LSRGVEYGVRRRSPGRLLLKWRYRWPRKRRTGVVSRRRPPGIPRIWHVSKMADTWFCLLEAARAHWTLSGEGPAIFSRESQWLWK